MASEASISEDESNDPLSSAALQHGQWRRQVRLSRVLAEMERILGTAGFDRAPWLVVAFAAGIAAWFGLSTYWDWLGLIALCLALAIGALVLLRVEGEYPYLRAALVALPLLFAAGCLTVWAKSELVGARPIERPGVVWMTARVINREERPAQERVRLILAARLDGADDSVRVRVNLPDKLDRKDVNPGAILRVRARLMPPAPPMLPGGYNFARTA